MNREQALQNLQLLIDAAVQKGLLSGAKEAIALQQSFDLLKSLSEKPAGLSAVN